MKNTLLSRRFHVNTLSIKHYSSTVDGLCHNLDQAPPTHTNTNTSRCLTCAPSSISRGIEKPLQKQANGAVASLQHICVSVCMNALPVETVENKVNPVVVPFVLSVINVKFMHNVLKVLPQHLHQIWTLQTYGGQSLRFAVAESWLTKTATFLRLVTGKQIKIITPAISGLCWYAI